MWIQDPINYEVTLYVGCVDQNLVAILWQLRFFLSLLNLHNKELLTLIETDLINFNFIFSILEKILLIEQRMNLIP